MATNKIQLRTVEEFTDSYRPKYNPLYGILLGRAKQYAEEVGIQKWNRLDAVGDLRAKHITPKDTELKQIGVAGSSKQFRKGFLANQFIQSQLQERGDVEGIVAQVLDEHMKQFDEMMLLGEGTAGNNVINNGLYWSGDTNYTLETSEQLRNAPDTQNDFYDLLQGNLSDAREVSGRKAIVIYGEDALAKLDSLMPVDATTSLRSVVNGALEGSETIVRMPKDITPSGANGWIIVSLDEVMFHYLTLPKLADQGVNAEKMYSWHNFLMGTCMVEVEAPNAIIRQPVTFEA